MADKMHDFCVAYAAVYFESPDNTYIVTAEHACNYVKEICNRGKLGKMFIACQEGRFIDFYREEML